MRTLALVGLFIVPLLAPRPIQARWESARDNQSPTALSALSNQELFNEAFDVCVRRAILGTMSATDDTRQAVAECNDYLTTLFPIIRERNGGNVPPWMNEIVAARTTAECQDAFHTFLSKPEKPTATGRAKGAAAAKSPRPTAAAKRTPARLPTANPAATPAVPPTPAPPPTAVPSATSVPPRPTATPKATLPPRPTATPKAPVPPRPTATPKGTPAQPHSGWSEQLPPWLAPH